MYYSWENLTHIFVEESDKEKAKAAFGFTAVPFYVVFDKDGTIVASGDSKTIDYVSLIPNTSSVDSKVQASATQNLVSFDEDF